MKPVTGHHRWLFGLCLPLLLAARITAAEVAAFTESVVIFNTVCARCHEGECSGRLSLANEHEAAVSHILRHYRQAEGKPSLQSELFDVLAYMKDHCAYYPLQAPIPPDRVWDASRLDPMRTDPEGAYFVPLGPLSPGEYRIGLAFERDVQATIQLLSGQFDMVVEESLATADRRLDIPFPVEAAGDYYFRMYPQRATRVTRLAVTPAGNTVVTH